MTVRITTTLALACTLLLPVSAFAQASVLTQHNDAARTGANLAEVVLTTTNVNVSQFGKLFERIVDDEIYGQPLYVEGVNVLGVVRNVVYVTTNNDSVYAFDADDPAASAPLWHVNYTNPAGGVVPVPRADVGQACGTYRDFANQIGIGGTPAIDPVSQTIYFVTRTKENGAYFQRLHAVNIADGTARSIPRVIQASVSGTGDGNTQGIIAFNPRTHNQRAGLLLDRGTVYIAWASYCDQGPYHGWILGYDATSLQQVMVYNTTPNGGLGGIWQSGGGLTADSTGNLYALTGNGSFNGNVAGGANFGNSFLKISPAGTLLDWFTPFNWSFLNATDEDLGVQNALLIPNTNLIVGGGKEGVFYVLDRNNMGHFRSANNGQIVQSFQGSSAQRMNGAPVYWNSPTYGPAIYVWPAGDPLKVFRLVGSLFTTPASAQSSALAAPGMPGGMLSLSANGGLGGTGILWATLSRAGDANHMPQPGILRAYDAGNVTRELWNSQQNAARDTLGNFSKFSPPTVANGKVFVASLSNKLVVYGLIGPAAGNTVPVVSAGADQNLTSPGTTTLTGTATDDGNPVPPGALTTTWTLINGPASVAFSAPNAPSTSATFSAPGTYTIRLSGSDGQATASDDVVVTVDVPAGAGTGLLAQYFNDAGSGIYFTALVLTRTDSIVDFDWAMVAPNPAVQADNFSVRWSGEIKAPVTGNYTFTTTSDDGVRLYVNGQLVIDNWTDHAVVQNSGTAALVADQTYDIRMEFYDHGQHATARLSWAYPGQTVQIVPQWVLYAAPAINQPPTVDAGADQTITLPAAASLNGIARDDGLPGPSLTTTWSKISGREDSAGGTVTFGNLNAPVTTATFGADGIYVLRLTVSDGAVTVSDDVTVIVNPAPANTAPVVNAGADRTITLPASTTLAATATDDGQPSPPAQMSRSWSRVSGPGTVTFSAPSSLSTSATFSVAGTYVLRLAVSDSVFTTSDDVTVTVNPAPATGLTARYYKDPGTGTRFTTLVVTRVDPTVNFTWGTAAPAAGVTADNFSVRWTGRVQAPVTGTYRFSTVSDDGIRLWINGQLVINNWTDHAPTTNTSAAISLTAGVRYTVTLEYYEKGGGATARLQWSYTGQSLQVIPQTRLSQ